MKMKIKNITVNERRGTDLMGFRNSKHFKCLWFNCRQNKKFTYILLWFLCFNGCTVIVPINLLQWRIIDFL